MSRSVFGAGSSQRKAQARVAQADAKDAARAAADLRSQNESMQFELDRLFMITEALWTILKKQHAYTDDQLVQTIQDIDLKDGTLDGKVSQSAERPTCSQCGRTILRRQFRCAYCGAIAPQQIFDR